MSDGWRPRRALITLEREVLPRLADIAAERAVIERRLRDVQGQLSEIGGGSPEAGSARVAQALALEEAASALKADLRRRYRGLSALELDAASNLKVAEEEALITAEADRLRVQMNELLAMVEAHEDLCDQTPGVWSAVDEPIRRYLLYGGEAADDFLIHSVALYSRFTDRGAVPQVTDDLPSRVVVAFDDWYRQRQQEQAHRDTGSETNHSSSHTVGPLIYYDPLAQEIMVRVPTHSGCRWDADNRVELELVGTESRKQRQVIPLRLYRRPDGSTETEAREFPLLFPSERYALRLKSGGQVVCDWNWVGTADRQHIVFSRTSGHLAPGHELPRERVYLVINAAFRVEPESCVLETVSLHGPWHGFTAQTLDPAGLDCLTLVHSLEPSQSYSIPIAPESLPILQLLGGQLLEGITSNGQPVYTMAPDEIRIPLHSEAELRLWHLSLTQHTVRPHRTIHLRVSELEASGAVQRGNGYASIKLTHSMLLGSGASGDFVVRLRRPPFRDWQCSFAILPGLAVQFDQTVYAPYAPGKVPSAQVTIDLADSSSLTVLLPARLIQSDGLRQCVQASVRDDFVRVAVKLGDMDLPLTIALPKTYWRLQGLADASASLWRDQIQEEETWLGDWQGLAELFLVVALPPSVNGDLVLNLEGAMGRADRQVLRRGNPRFNLLAFRDALRSGSALRELRLALEQTQPAFPPVPLLAGALPVGSGCCGMLAGIEGPQDRADSYLARERQDRRPGPNGPSLAIWAFRRPALGGRNRGQGCLPGPIAGRQQSGSTGGVSAPVHFAGSVDGQPAAMSGVRHCQLPCDCHRAKRGDLRGLSDRHYKSAASALEPVHAQRSARARTVSHSHRGQNHQQGTAAGRERQWSASHSNE